MGRKALCLIEVRGQEFLVGISGDRISPLGVIPGKSSISFAETLKNSGASSQP
jgi:flagellar biogenesis protein FliO